MRLSCEPLDKLRNAGVIKTNIYAYAEAAIFQNPVSICESSLALVKASKRDGKTHLCCMNKYGYQFLNSARRLFHGVLLYQV